LKICMIRITSHKEEDIHLETVTEEDVKGRPILFSEFEAALSHSINGKVEGKDGIPYQQNRLKH